MNALNQAVINERSDLRGENPSDAAVHKNHRDLFISTGTNRLCCDATEIMRGRRMGQGWEGNGEDIGLFLIGCGKFSSA
ncbi:hypothetical protein PQR70_34495 [Paraburkholderia madseniana]|uniref:hypothetical protein n=1 Tax=Paraburkholderia madseniana TaxID=2599607 RepID=UPI0038BD2FD4